MADSKALTELKSFLNKLFQFESQDLDFGIYKILHYKRKEVKGFIDKLLTDKVKEQLQIFDAEQKNIIKQNLQELEADEIIINYNTALGSSPADAEVFYKYNKTKIVHYLQVKREYDAIAKNDNTEETIYNHLTLFFSRYYDKGDFISKRRFGKNEKYVVPYNGEETHFYWANHDQYYIKSSEYFQQFAFKIPQLTGTLTVNFKLADAKTEQGNVKADENKYFVLSEKPAELTDTELHIFFEFRPLTEAEKKSFTGNGKQDTLNERAATAIKEQWNKNTATAELWKEDDKQQTLLLKKLNHYTRKNSYDFFIHKDLKGFLQRELDFYIKSELVKVEDLYVLDSEQHFENIRHNFKLIKCFKNIADTIIDFLTQIEEFQKKLWEKKKFVLTTEWVVTIDKLAEWLDTKIFESIIKQVLKNENQAAEWKQLFGWDKLPFALTIEGLKADLHNWYKLPIDTKHFDSVFKEILLNVLSEKINIEEEANGLLIHSDNYHGLKLLKNKFQEQIGGVYIDPPYNSGGNDFIYKDSFRNSSWLTMLYDRVTLSRDFLTEDAIFFTSIDDKDSSNKVTHKLSNLLEGVFGKENYIENIIWVKNTTHNDATTFSHNHEYIQCYTKNKVSAIAKNDSFRREKPGYSEVKELVHKLNAEYPTIEKIREELKALYKAHQEEYKKECESLGLEWNDEVKKNDPWKGIVQYKYADYRKDGKFIEEENAKIKKATIWVYREDNPSWPNANTLTKKHKDPESEEYRFYMPIHPVTKMPCPAPKRGWICKAKNGNGSAMTFEKLVKDYLIHFGEDENKVPQTKRFLDKVSTDVAKSIISDFSDGEKELANIVGIRGTFPNPKPSTLIQNLLALSSNNSGYIMDFFPGSGTTIQALARLNNSKEISLKYILTEIGNHIYLTIIPRIKKIAYSFDWKEGKPQNMNGLGVFIKYQRLEQYEEALENIAFTATDKTIQQAMAFDNYIPKYFLELETRGSKTLVNIAAMQNPWGYKLKVWDGFTYDTEQAVDLVETFNYLIGLHVQKYFARDNKGRKYVFVWGWNNEQKKSLVIWRDITGWKEKEYENDREYIESNLTGFEYDNLYINGQSTLPGYQMIEDIFKTKMIPE